MKFNSSASVYDAFFFSLMIGIGESYLAAFALSKHMSEVSSGLMITLPLVAGAVLAFFLNTIFQKKESIKSWVTSSVFMQATCFLPLMVMTQLEHVSVAALFFFVSLYFAFGFVAGPAWNYWLASLVATKEVHHFLSQRYRVSQMGHFLGLILGGQILHFYSQSFVVLFAIAMLARVLSGIFLLKQPHLLQKDHPPIHSVKRVFKKFIERSLFRNFFAFLFVFYMVIFISSPFVNPFFLADLKFDYEQYMFALVALLVGKVLLLPLAPRLIERWGVKRIFFVGALGISPLPIVWVFSKSYHGALLLQLTSGVFWALFEVGFSVIFFNHLKVQDKIAVLSIHNFFNSLAILLGSLVGAQILIYFQSQSQGYDAIFVVGAALRLVTVMFFAWFLRGESLNKLSV